MESPNKYRADDITTPRPGSEWAKRLKNVIFIDMDGWDRENFAYSFYEEVIDFAEFCRRLEDCTIKIID